MKKLLLLLLALLPALPALAILPPPETVNTELGITRMKAMYPEPGAIISDARPIIAVDFSRLEIPVDTESVVVMLDRSDVTSAAEITPAYIIFTPAAPLSAGLHEVRVLANDLNRSVIEPLTWNFTVKTAAATTQPPAQPETTLDMEQKPDNTAGSFFVSSDYTTADYVDQPFFNVAQLFNEKEGMKVNSDFSFSNVDSERTITGYFFRDTLPYIDTERDRGGITYSNDDFTLNVGHYWFRMSDLTVVGTELAGIKYNSSFGHHWNLTLFGGRTQDPSTDGTYKQVSSGFKSDYKWNPKHMSSLTGITAWESDDVYYSTLAGFPESARDDIVSLAHEYRYSSNIAARLELATNVRKERSGAHRLHDSASKLELRAKQGPVSGEAEVYSIGENYMPVSDNNSKYLNNDRAGIKLKGRYQPVKILTVGGEYEQYETPSIEKDTTRGNVFVALSSGAVQSLMLRHEKLGSEQGVGSENTGVTLVLGTKSLGPLKDTRLTAGWQTIQYDTPSVAADTTVVVLAFSTRIASRLSVNLGFSGSDGESDTAALADIPYESSNMYFGLDWDVIPSRLLWNWKYEKIQYEGLNTDSDETRLKTLLKYRFDKTYNMSLGFDLIDYSDSVTPGNDYSQKIIRTGMGMDF